MTWLPGPRLPILLDSSFPLPLDRPFTRGQALSAGLTRHALDRLLEQGLVRRMLRGVYVAAQVTDDLLLRTHALALVAPRDSVAVDWTACWLHTGVAPPGAHEVVPPVSFFRPAGGNRLRNGLCRSGERTLLARDVQPLGDMLVTTPLRTALDLGRLVHRDQGIAALDALLRHGAFAHDELLSEVERFRKQRGVVQLRALAPLADPRAESPPESVLRLRWLDLGSLPPPQPQVSLRLPDGREVYRIDLGVEELRFGVEYDGHEHHSTLADLEHDRRRRRELAERFGWLIVPVTRENVFGHGRDIERILHEGVREARARLGRHRPPA